MGLFCSSRHFVLNHSPKFPEIEELLIAIASTMFGPESSNVNYPLHLSSERLIAQLGLYHQCNLCAPHREPLVKSDAEILLHRTDIRSTAVYMSLIAVGTMSKEVV